MKEAFAAYTSRCFDPVPPAHSHVLPMIRAWPEWKRHRTLRPSMRKFLIAKGMWSIRNWLRILRCLTICRSSWCVPATGCL